MTKTTMTLERTLDMTAQPAREAPSREELIEFIRAICEGDVPIGSGGRVHGTRAIELAAWELYRRLQEGGEL